VLLSVQRSARSCRGVRGSEARDTRGHNGLRSSRSASHRTGAGRPSRGGGASSLAASQRTTLIFTLRLHGQGVSADWRSAGTGWTDGESRIAAYIHPALETIAAASEGRLLLGVRERLRGTPARPAGAAGDPLPAVSHVELEAIRRELAEWPLQCTTIEIDTRSTSTRGRIVAGKWGVAPVYLVERGGMLLGHWDPSELYPYLPAPELHTEHAAHYLIAFSTPYSKNTMLRGMRVVTAGAAASWEAHGGREPTLDIQYPPPFRGHKPRELVPGAPVLERFGEIMAASMRRWADADAPSAELSGGLDSGIVSATAAMIHEKRVRTYGIVHDGTMGTEQRARRDELVERCGLIDHVVLAARHPPLDPESSRISGSRVVPWEEIYFEAVESLLDIASSHGTRVLYAGFGGDELFYPNWDEVSAERKRELLADLADGRRDGPDWISAPMYDAFQESLEARDEAPIGAISDSTLDSVAFGSASYLRKGIWPVHPYCTPELIRFCRSLPFEWRKNRALQRELLRRMGLSERYAYPTEPESFTPLLERGLMRHNPFIQTLFSDSRMAARGHIDARRFLTRFAEYTSLGSRQYEPKDFYATIILELTLRSWETRRSTARDRDRSFSSSER
jgi:asparagine synthase (glutamine-hydrolysing)